GLRASEGPHGNLPRRGVRGELLAEDQDRGGGRSGSGRQNRRHDHRSRQDRSDRGRENLRPLARHRRAHPHRRDRHRSALKPALKVYRQELDPMTLKNPTRAGLMALALGLLFTLFLTMSAINGSYAEEATTAPAAEASASPPACAGNPDPKLAVLENCTPN